MKTLQMNIMICFGVLFSILILIILAILLLNRAVLGTNSPKAMRLLVMALAPPKDLYDYLINEELNISEKGLIKRFEFKSKYAGRHDVGIVLDKFSDDLYFKPLSQRYILKLKMEVNFYLQNSLILSRVVEDKYDAFIGRKGNGFSFITYDSGLCHCFKRVSFIVFKQGVDEKGKHGHLLFAEACGEIFQKLI